MKKGELKPYQEIIKENVDIMVNFKDKDSKVSMAEEIIYSVIKMATGNDLLSAGDILRDTTITLLVNTD